MPDIFVAPKEEKQEKKPLIEPKISPTNQEQKGGSLAAFISYPDNVRFDTQSEEEEIILLLRKHWITNLFWLTTTLILIFFPPVVFPVLALRQILPTILPNFGLVLLAFWYLITFGFALVNFISWYFNVYIVTNERIIDVDFYNLLYRKLSSARIARVQDVTYKLGGVVRSLFDFGDVFIQTAGTEANFEFEAVPQPESVVRKISDLMERYEEKPV